MNKREREETKGSKEEEDERDDAPSTSLARHAGSSAEEVQENKRARIQTEEGETLIPNPMHLTRETTEHEVVETSCPAFTVNEEGIVRELKPDQVEDGQRQGPSHESLSGGEWYLLGIRFEAVGDRFPDLRRDMFTLKAPADRTIQSIRGDVELLTNIPSSQQLWPWDSDAHCLDEVVPLRQTSWNPALTTFSLRVKHNSGSEANFRNENECMLQRQTGDQQSVECQGLGASGGGGQVKEEQLCFGNGENQTVGSLKDSSDGQNSSTLDRETITTSALLSQPLLELSSNDQISSSLNGATITPSNNEDGTSFVQLVSNDQISSSMDGESGTNTTNNTLDDQSLQISSSASRNTSNTLDGQSLHVLKCHELTLTDQISSFLDEEVMAISITQDSQSFHEPTSNDQISSSMDKVDMTISDALIGQSLHEPTSSDQISSFLVGEGINISDALVGQSLHEPTSNDQITSSWDGDGLTVSDALDGQILHEPTSNDQITSSLDGDSSTISDALDGQILHESTSGDQISSSLSGTTSNTLKGHSLLERTSDDQLSSSLDGESGTPCDALDGNSFHEPTIDNQISSVMDTECITISNAEQDGTALQKSTSDDQISSSLDVRNKTTFKDEEFKILQYEEGLELNSQASKMEGITISDGGNYSTLLENILIPGRENGLALLSNPDKELASGDDSSYFENESDPILSSQIEVCMEGEGVVSTLKGDDSTLEGVVSTLEGDAGAHAGAQDDVNNLMSALESNVSLSLLDQKDGSALVTSIQLQTEGSFLQTICNKDIIVWHHSRDLETDCNNDTSANEEVATNSNNNDGTNEGVATSSNNNNGSTNKNAAANCNNNGSTNEEVSSRGSDDARSRSEEAVSGGTVDGTVDAVDLSTGLNGANATGEDVEITRDVRSVPSDNFTTEKSLVDKFVAEISTASVSCENLFFPGTLALAIKGSCAAPFRDRKPLALYLHDTNGDAKNSFVNRIFGDPGVVEALKNGFVTWGWDISQLNMKLRLLEIMKTHFGNDMQRQVSSIPKDNFPVIILILKEGGSYDAVEMMEGAVTPSEAVQVLETTLEMASEANLAVAEQEHQREIRENILREQDDAYQTSLADDRERERKKEEKEARERAEEEQRREEEEQRKEEERKVEERKKKERQAIKDLLPPEPTPSHLTTRICLRTPAGDSLTRNFLLSDSIRTLFQFAASEGFATDEYKLLEGFPRRDLTSHQHAQRGRGGGGGGGSTDQRVKEWQVGAINQQEQREGAMGIEQPAQRRGGDGGGGGGGGAIDLDQSLEHLGFFPRVMIFVERR